MALRSSFPPEWEEGYEDGVSYYNGDASITFEITSLKAGDTLDAWVKRQTETFNNRVADKYKEPTVVSDIVWNGIPAKLVKFSFTQDGTTWADYYEIFAVKGAYKYDTGYTYDRDGESNRGDILGILQKSMKVDFAKVEKTFGQVPDSEDDIDQNKTVTKTSKKYGYSVTVPEEWTQSGMDMERDAVTFSTAGIQLAIAMEKGSTMQGYPEMLEKTYTSTGIWKVDSRTDEKFAGESAVKFTLVPNVVSTAGGKVTSYLLEKNGGIYLIQAVVSDANATDFNLKRIEEALKSFKFNN
ncbi:hypothetical protein OMP38_30240 [Cohnella ginsengisoli]|uniref:Uncharacterized protein n=1 Tax=Cohnella ginsengisoli TaxID=425004 RepID=A0A9X4QRA1_9BACL|nr:hypothetical protein [Cohnella ginsengisoli]MDG0794645.1 hypothetical protein [Cohnella ginsengisoli]